MKSNRPIAVLFTICVSATAFGQQARAKLEGMVFNHQNRPVSGVRVVVPGGQAVAADVKNGHFTIRFPDNIQPGQATRIMIAKANWVVYQPMFGNCVTQSTERNYEPLKVIIVPKSSPLALSPERLSQVIAQWSNEKGKLQSRLVHLSEEVTDLNRQVDEYAFLRDYAQQYGFTLDRVKAAATEWARIKDSDDKESRALKQFWLANYANAAQLARESAKEAEQDLEKVYEERFIAGRKVIRRHQLEGNAFEEQYKFDEALLAYLEVERLFDTRKLLKDDFISEWSELKTSIGDVKRRLAESVLGDKSTQLLLEAVKAYEEAQSIYPREQSAPGWASVEVDKAIALLRLGEQTAGPEGLKYLNDSVAALNAALAIRTRDRFRLEWASTQTALAAALASLATRTSGEESIKYLNDAVLAHRSALVIRTHDEYPSQWAQMQNNLCTALIALGRRESGAVGLTHLNEAVAACRAALTVDTRDEYPQKWALDQNNLGVALMRIGERSSGSESLRYLNDAVKAYESALEIRTVDNQPRKWLLSQNNLAKTYFTLTDWAKATEAYEKILKVDPGTEVYNRLFWSYQNRLFQFDKAFALNQQWLNRYVDLVAEVNFAESHFTTSRFPECEQRINRLLKLPEIPVGSKVALRAIEISSLLAENKTSDIHVKIEALITDVRRQSADFKVSWAFDGTRHFIDQNEKLLTHRAWLGQLFDAMGSKDRDTMLKALQDTRAKFKERTEGSLRMES